MLLEKGRMERKWEHFDLALEMKEERDWLSFVNRGRWQKLTPVLSMIKDVDIHGKDQEIQGGFNLTFSLSGKDIETV